MNVNADSEGMWRRQGLDDAARGGMDVPVVTQDMYDTGRAKIAANLSWLFSKAFGTDDVPSDLQDPFYTDQYDQEHIKPPIIHLLLSSELYCTVCGLLLQPEHATFVQNHTSVLQVLSQKGISVLDNNDVLISEVDLASTPIKMSSHIHLIDALMMAYIKEMINTEKVLSSVKCFSEINDATEVPMDLEAAMVFWINNVIIKVMELTQTTQKVKHHLQDSLGHQKVHYCKDQLYGRSDKHFSLLDNLSNFPCNGTALLAVIHFYCPELIRVEDICMKDTPSTTESLYNTELLREFSDEFLNKCFHLRSEDMLYSPPVLKINMMQYIAELFWAFETVMTDLRQPRDIPAIEDVRMRWQQQRSNTPKHNRSWDLNFKKTVTGATSPEICFRTSTNLSVAPQSRKEHKLIKDRTLGQRNWTHLITHATGQQCTMFPQPRNIQRSLSQTAVNPLNVPLKEEAKSIIPTCALTKQSWAPKFMSTTQRHVLGSGHRGRLSGQSLLDHIRFEDEVEEIEEEELVAVIDPSTLPCRRHQCETQKKDSYLTSASRLTNTCASPELDACSFLTEPLVNKYYLEPLMPAIQKPAKEKSVNMKKEEECGESDSKETVKKISSSGSGALHRIALQSDSKYVTDTSLACLRAATQRSKPSCGFYLHLLEGPKGDSPLSSLEASKDSDSDVENFTDHEDELQIIGNKARSLECCHKQKQNNFEESDKLREDLKVNEYDDKDDHSGYSSPYFSTVSGSSSCNTPSETGVKMTSFAEKRRLKLGRDGLSSASTTPKTTPDGTEVDTCESWQMKKSGSSHSIDKETYSESRNSVTVPSELLELHMELEERRHVIECQKMKMESFSAQQRLKFGKAAFLNIVKKEPGKSDTLPLLRKQQSSVLRSAGKSEVTKQNCKDDSCLESLKMKAIQNDNTFLTKDNKLLDSRQNLNVSSHSIEVLNEAIATIQQQIMQLSQQQDVLIKHSSVFPSKLELETNTTLTANPSAKSSVTETSCQPKLSPNQHKASSRKPLFQILDDKEKGELKGEVVAKCKIKQDKVRNGIIEDCNVINQQCDKYKTKHLPTASETLVTLSSTAAERVQPMDSENKASDAPEKSTRIKTQLIEVDLSEMGEPGDRSCTDTQNEQANALGFFFKDEEREDEMAKRRAAFLIKQQRKAEELKLRKQQIEAESDLKRDEARRKAEEDRIRKEEEKARREFIKQEYMRKKQQMLIEEKGLVKSFPRTRSRKSRPKSLHREGPNATIKGTTTPELTDSRRGSTFSLATEVESVISVESQCAESMCSMDFSVLSRSSSRNMERDWESGSIASSITSTEYTGPKLFKEPSSKSNKPIIINAIAHCCLAGKVNETQKNVILEELEKCDSNHLIILFRDGGCQFRAIYSYSPDTEEIIKVTGTGPRNISQKMIDKLYKYSSDRKQFSVIPAKSVSVSIDALTIHNHLWQIRRPGSARRK